MICTVLTKFDALATLSLELLTGNRDLAALTIVEYGGPINRACRTAQIAVSCLLLQCKRLLVGCLLPMKILQFLQAVTSTSEV